MHCKRRRDQAPVAPRTPLASAAQRAATASRQADHGRFAPLHLQIARGVDMPLNDADPSDPFTATALDPLRDANVQQRQQRLLSDLAAAHATPSVPARAIARAPGACFSRMRALSTSSILADPALMRETALELLEEQLDSAMETCRSLVASFGDGSARVPSADVQGQNLSLRIVSRIELASHALTEVQQHVANADAEDEQTARLMTEDAMLRMTGTDHRLLIRLRQDIRAYGTRLAELSDRVQDATNRALDAPPPPRQLDPRETDEKEDDRDLGLPPTPWQHSHPRSQFPSPHTEVQSDTDSHCLSDYS